MKKFLLCILALTLLAGVAFATEPPAAPALSPPAAPAKPKPPESKKGDNDACGCERPNRLNPNPPPCDCDNCRYHCFPLGNGATPKSAAVSVHVDMGNATAHGSGTVIATADGKSLVLTNAHVVESDRYPVSIVHRDEKGQPWSYSATYVGGSTVSHIGGSTISIEGPDLALLLIDHALPAAEIAAAQPAVGAKVSAYGFGAAQYGGEPVHRTGVVLGNPGFVEPAIKTTLQTVNGDSGSGIFNEAGQLVAVHWGGAAVPLDSVYTFTVATIERKKFRPFQALKEKLAARKIARLLESMPPPAAPAAAVTPAAFTFPSGSSCPNGQCPNAGTTYYYRRR